MKELRALLDAGLVSNTWISSSGFSTSIFNHSRLRNKTKCDAWKQTREGGVANKNDYDSRQIMAKHCHAILRIRFSRNYSLTIFLSWIKPTSRIRDNYHSTILLILIKSNLFSLGGHYKFHKMAESNCDTDYRKHLKIVTTRVKSSQCKCHAILRLRFSSRGSSQRQEFGIIIIAIAYCQWENWISFVSAGIIKEMTESNSHTGYRKCFCPNCHGCLRARRTVYRHHKLFGLDRSGWSECHSESNVPAKKAKFSDPHKPDLEGEFW